MSRRAVSEKDLTQTKLLGAEEMDHVVQRIGLEILEKHNGRQMAFVGIHERGVVLADRVYEAVSQKNKTVSRGTIDITLYRDDLDNLGTIPSVRGTELPFDVEGSLIVLFDDVLFTGRTIRAAIDVLIDYGRPARIELAVLVDRGNRELPICPNYTGKFVETRSNEYIRVRFHEGDGEDAVYLLREDSPR